MKISKKLKDLDIGESLFVETTLDTYAYHMRKLSPPRERRAKYLAGMEFKLGLFTAVAASPAGHVVHLIRITRIQ